MIPIDALWAKHVATAFPAHCVGEEFDGIALVFLDAAAAECISAYLEEGGTLDLRRTAMLGLCHRHLALVSRERDGEAQEYFHRLEVIVYEVLQAIRDSAPQV